MVPLSGVYAGFFDFFDDLGGAAVSADEPRSYPQAESSVLAAAINSEPNPWRGGPVIMIQDDALVPVLAPENVYPGDFEPSSDQIARYVVRSGDTLSSVAKMFGVSVNTVRWSNDIPASGKLKLGQELVILPIDGVSYTVRRGDTVASIAKKFKGDSDDILNFNDLDSPQDLAVGDEIIIPDGVIVPAPAPRTGNTSAIARYSGPEIVGYYLRPSSGPKTQGLHGNNGVDIGGPTGTTVMAAASGEVLIARSNGAWNGGYGNMIVVAHPNGTQTLYAHLSAVSVRVGERVSQGQKIGEVGNTGKSTGPHLHFEVRGARNPF